MTSEDIQKYFFSTLSFKWQTFPLMRIELLFVCVQQFLFIASEESSAAKYILHIGVFSLMQSLQF